MAVDWYAVMGVAPSATADELKKAKKKLAVKLHPDKNRDNAEKAAAAFMRMNKAFELLSDAKWRAAYDERRTAKVKRRQVDEARAEAMGAKRRKMRDDLEARVSAAAGGAF